MAPPRRVRCPGRGGVRSSKNTVGRTHSTKDKAGPKQKPTDVFDFPDNSVISSIGRLGENEKDEEPYEIFDPPLHSTAIYADEEEFSKHCGSSIPSTPQGKEVEKRSDTYEIEAGENMSVEMSARKPGRKVKPISDESESTEEGDIRRKVQSAEKIRIQAHEPTSDTPCTFLELPEKLAESVTPKKIRPLSAKSVVEKETVTEPHQSVREKTQKKMFGGKRKKSRSEAIDSDISDSVHIWCLKGKKASDIVDLDVVLSAFEKTILEYKQKVESKICKEAIKKFHSNMKEELIKMLKEVQMSKTLKRKNTKIISDIEKKRQRLLELQDELLWLEPQLKQLQIKHDELKERKSSLRNAVCFLSNLKKLHQDYSDIREKEPHVKETYDSSSLPALLLKARTLLRAENHLQNINHQLEKLLDQKDQSTEM
ncbi:centromere protein U isoform X1 [Zalophus californianus]|uniref:Centromere protein U n=1 Tax=Zalophus californianus TaxID=9704 RepID=A0A6J2DDB1_ZALCA|nr:centromere protein U isoform X1 [Zalophus californianus]